MTRAALLCSFLPAALLLAAPAAAGGVAASQHPPLPSAREIAELPEDGGPEFNRLVFEASPYLRLHARNPVDWYPWGPAAFERARAEEKPIFLSIGYSTCHWCHVMARESFQDEAIAARLNQAFVCVKVDREERPDVDAIYMDYCQALTGGGGWPLTVVMTPDGRAFFAGTYFPPEPALGKPGLLDVASDLERAWAQEREAVVASAARIRDQVLARTALQSGPLPGEPLLKSARVDLGQRFDPANGGFMRAPKFPMAHPMRLLLRFAAAGDLEALSMVDQTLQAWWRGGIHDQLGGGFHRYATDEYWLLPHFEKMLHDQALIALTATEAYELRRRPEDRALVLDVLGYVRRDLTSPEGAFYSAEDAESEGVEGRFYVWTLAELRAALGDQAAAAAAHFGVTAEGERHVLHLARPEVGTSEQQAAWRRELLAARAARPRPHRDDKVLTDWNGLMIAAFARAARALDDPSLARDAERAAEFAWTHLRDGEGRLLKRWRDGAAGLPGLLDDHAYLAWGLLELYQATFDERHLERALALTDAMLERFWDERAGGFYLTPEGAEALVLRPKEPNDYALPSGNSVAACNLILLSRMTGRSEYEARAVELFEAFAGTVVRYPSAHTHLLLALDLLVHGTTEVVVCGEPGAEDTRAMLRALADRFGPRTTVLLRPAGEAEPAIARLAPWTKDQTAIDGKATAYVCRDQACDRPATSVAELLERLRAADEPAAGDR